MLVRYQFLLVKHGKFLFGIIWVLLHQVQVGKEVFFETVEFQSLFLLGVYVLVVQELLDVGLRVGHPCLYQLMVEETLFIDVAHSMEVEAAVCLFSTAIHILHLFS